MPKIISTLDNMKNRSKNNPLRAIQRLIGKVEMQEIKDVEVNRLSELSPVNGTVDADVSAADETSGSYEPTDSDYTGTFFRSSPVDFGGVLYNMGGVIAGVLQWGASIAGKIIAGANAVTLDENGISIQSTTDPDTIETEKSLKFVDSSGNIVSHYYTRILTDDDQTSTVIYGFNPSAYSGHIVDVSLFAETDSGSASVIVQSDPNADNAVFINADTTNITANTTTINLSAGSFEVDETKSNASVNGIFLGLGNPTELTISSGAVTATQSYHRIDTEGNAATDDLDTINGGNEGDILVLITESSLRNVTFKDGTGNLRLAGDFTAGNVNQTLTLLKSGTNWIELSRSAN